jgi:myo-inositol-1(or 4)-monophosphatase
MAPMNEFLDVAIAAAQAAGRIHRFYAADADKQVDTKANFADIVTKVDKLSEARIREVLSGAFPDHAVLGEEGGEKGAAGATHRWIVDPLDGTTNYAARFPFYCVSVALEIEGTVEVGVVLDSVRDRLYTAVRGQGARVDGGPIAVTGTTELRQAVVSTGFNAVEDDIRENLGAFALGLREARAVRRAGAGALDLCLVACGSADAFWELTLNPWDVAAGTLIVREAGGKVTDERGAEYDIRHPVLVASNGHLHGQLLDLLKRGGVRER